MVSSHKESTGGQAHLNVFYIATYTPDVPLSISSVSLDDANTELTVNFSKDVYTNTGSSGDLTVADFNISLSGSGASLNSTPITNISKTNQSVWVLTINLDNLSSMSASQVIMFLYYGKNKKAK